MFLFALLSLLSIMGMRTEAQTTTAAGTVHKRLNFSAVSQIAAKALQQGDPLTAAKGKKGVVLFFLGTDCPISNAYAPEIKRICSHYASKDIAFALIYPDPDLSLADIKKHVKAYGYTCPAFLDPAHRLTHKAGSTVTPQAVIFSPCGRLLYRGRIDNLYVDWGKPRFEATQHDLRSALDAVAAGKTVPRKFTDAIGCFIPDVR